ncbi:MAG: serine/threonine protein kinase [Xanthomonadales bacterium]|nr:serine/threonine protein kinase [Xanthomonadales bacterium]
MASPQPIPGYQLLKQIGSGGMATVYLALQVSLDRKVAIKVLRTSPGDDPERTEKRFLREGRTLAKITHKNVCGIYDIAKIGNVAYIAMEYLDGGTLVDKLKQGVSVGESIAIVVQVASALDEAHKLGIIHRDLKPANVMLRSGRVPVLTDFGIARELTASQTRITAENMIVGTPIYMSPEQVSGGEVDGRSDLYSLGVMFFELLTGQPPFKGETPIAVCMQHLTAPIPQLPPEIADLQPVVECMLAKKREDRYESMSQFTHALRDVFVTSETMRQVASFHSATPWTEQLRDLGFSFDTIRDADVKAALEAQRKRQLGSPQSRVDERAATVAARRPVVGRRWPLWVALAVLLLALAGGGWWWAQRPRPPTETERLALAQLRLEFTERIGKGQLFEPMGESALDVAGRMRKVHASSDETIAVFESLERAVLARAQAEIQRRDLVALDVTLAAIAVALPELPQRAELERQRADIATALAGEAAMRERLVRLKALLEGAKPAAGESVLGLYLDLRPALAGDREFQTLEPAAQRAARAAIEVALAAGDEAGALADARRLLQTLPGDPDLAALVERLTMSVAKAELARAAADWSEQLKTQAIDSERLAQLLAGLKKLAELKQPPADHAKLRELLANAVVLDANALIRKGELDGALGLLGQARAGLGDVPQLVQAQNQAEQARERASAQQRVDQEQARQGQVAISAAPWARIEAIVDSGGRRVALPAEPSTPLLLTLPEGQYRITLSAGSGTGRLQQGVTVTRGRLTPVSLRFEGYGAEQYLREVRW